VVVDTLDGVIAEAGELIIPLKDRIITPDHIVCDLHQLLVGNVQVRNSAQDVTLFKSVGCALEDLAVATLVYEEMMRQATA
jgi:ornithine cyclodeaminase/alanine dehydrogenase-like protein (mu-crystallin family)